MFSITSDLIIFWPLSFLLSPMMFPASATETKPLTSRGKHASQKVWPSNPKLSHYDNVAFRDVDRNSQAIGKIP